MRLKKIATVILTGAIVVASVIPVMASEIETIENVEDLFHYYLDNHLARPETMLVCGVEAYANGEWGDYSQGFEITEELKTFQFTNTTRRNPAGVDCGPIYIVYTGNENVYNGDGYSEIFYSYADGYAWCYGELGKYANAAGQGENKTNILGDVTGELTEGYSFYVSALPEDWNDYLADLMAGCEVTVTARLVGEKAVLTSSCAGVEYTAEIPVGDLETVYLGFSGDHTILTDLSVDGVPVAWGGAPEVDDGDDIVDEPEESDDGNEVVDESEDPGDTENDQNETGETEITGGEVQAPKTADTLPLIPIATGLCGCALIAAVAGRKTWGRNSN